MNLLNDGSIYLLIEREFIRLKEQVFKIGRTKQENNKRFNSYPKGSELLLQVKCPNCVIVESHLIQMFKIKYTQCKQYGTEYFEGDPEAMIDDIMIVVKKHKNIMSKKDYCIKRETNIFDDEIISESDNEEIL